MKIAVVTDSGSNIYHEKVEVAGVYKVPLQIIDGDKGYREGVEITIEDTYEMVFQGKMLKTSLPLVGDIVALFKQLKEEGYDMIFGVPITTGLSSTIPAMVSAARQVDIDFDYFDCYTTAMVQLECALGARKLFDQGASVELVKQRLQDAIDQSVTFVLPTDLMHLSRGGRLSPTAAKIAGMLKINPVLYLNEETEGRIESYQLTRTMRRAQKVALDYFRDKGVGEGYRICVTHVRALADGQRFLKMVEEAFPLAQAYLVDLISVVGVHTGIGCVATQFVKKVETVI